MDGIKSADGKYRFERTARIIMRLAPGATANGRAPRTVMGLTRASISSKRVIVTVVIVPAAVAAVASFTDGTRVHGLSRITPVEQALHSFMPVTAASLAQIRT